MKQTGFTLLELSIVIAIIGLIAGGLVAGTSLIRAAQIRAVLTQKTEFSTAVIAFNLKYNELPGDMVNATKIWGTAAACPGDETTPSTDETTCDGDGDGEIDYYYYPGPVDSGELHRAWQHLANAELVSGSFTGVQATSASMRSFSPNVNAPGSKIAASLFTINSYQKKLATDGSFWEGLYFSSLVFSGVQATGIATKRLLSPSEAWSIDNKIDDGMPQYGKTRTMRKNTHPDCTTTNVEATTEYNLTYEADDACVLLFTDWF